MSKSLCQRVLLIALAGIVALASPAFAQNINTPTRIALTQSAATSLCGSLPATAPLVALPGSAPAARYHASKSFVATSNGRVTSWSDLQGLADATDAGSGAGPLPLKDGCGWKFMRGNADAFLEIAPTINLLPRSSAVFIVGRVHKAKIFNQTFVSAGINRLGTGATGDRLANLTNAASGQSPFVGNATGALTNKSYLIAGAQMQVMGWVNRAGASAGVANSGQRIYVNNKAANCVQIGFSVGANGGELWRYSQTPGASGNWAPADFYEVIIYTGTLTDAQADAIVAALTAAYHIPEVTDEVVLEGDSRTDGVSAGTYQPLTSGDNVAMFLTNPGNPRAFPATTRVVNMAASGSTTDTGSAQMLARRDATNTIFDQLIPGGYNKLYFMIGVNDWGAPARDGATTYAHMWPLINTTTTGYLQRGWEVYLGIEMSSSSANAVKQADYRALERADQFLTDTLSNTGQAYDGKVHRIEIPNILVNGTTIFDTSTNAQNTAYYQGDQTHPNITGTKAYGTGGDTPANGIRSMVN